MMTDQLETWPKRHPAAVIVALFVAARLIGLMLGMRFDADNLTTWMQIADVALLRDHLWRTLWYLHTQPPLFNLLIGIAMRFGPNGFGWFLWTVYAVIALGGILSLHALVRDLTARPRLAMIVAAWLCVSPAVLLFSQKLYYDGLVPWLLCMAIWGLHAGMTRRSAAELAFGFAMLAVTVLLRSMIHPLLFVAILLIYLVAAPGQRLRVLAAAALPAAAIGAVMAKNLIVFGAAGLSSWAPLNLDHTTFDRLSTARRAELMHEGKLSRFGMIDAFSPPAAYLALLPPARPTGEPSLDDLRKSTGGDNWNHIVYTRIGKQRSHDALIGLEADPAGFAKIVGTSLYHFHRPPSEFKGLERNLAAIAPWERLTNATIGLQPVAWLGGTLDPARPSSPLLQVAYTELLVTLGFIGGVVLLAARLFGDVRARRWPVPREAIGAAIALLGCWVILISSSFDVWENNRARFDIAPVLLLGALGFASWIADRIAARERPAIRTPPPAPARTRT